MIFADVATEKTQKSLFDGIEKFDSSQLKHTETQEKNPLPDKDGTFVSPRCSVYLLNARMQFAFCYVSIINVVYAVL